MPTITFTDADPASSATLVVSVDEANRFCRIDGATEDSLVESLIVAATKWAEDHAFSNCSLLAQSRELTLDEFPDVVIVPRPPLRSVTSIQYYDAAGTLQTLSTDDYIVANACQPGRIVPAYGGVWPVTQDRPDAVRIQYMAGYDDVPDNLKLAVLYRTWALYDRDPERAESLTKVAESLLAQSWHGQMT